MNKYEVLGVIGEGAYGHVFKARNKETNELVAVKRFKESEKNEQVRKTTLREVKILRSLRQENIVLLKEAFRKGGKLHLVFEYVERNLLEVLDEHPHGLDPETIRSFMFQLARAIEYCHRHDIIHRDIKPENILISSDQTLKICDFGFSRSKSYSNSPYTDYVATRWYRAPDLLLATTDYDEKVDIWAMGCIMGEIIDGQPLFPGKSEIDQLYIIQKVQGPLTRKQMKQFFNNPHLREAKVSGEDMTNLEPLDKRFGRKIDSAALSFMKSLLCNDPEERLSGASCLRHEYFQKYDQHKISDPVPSAVHTNWESTRPPSPSYQGNDDLSHLRLPSSLGRSTSRELPMLHRSREATASGAKMRTKKVLDPVIAYESVSKGKRSVVTRKRGPSSKKGRTISSLSVVVDDSLAKATKKGLSYDYPDTKDKIMKAYDISSSLSTTKFSRRSKVRTKLPLAGRENSQRRKESSRGEDRKSQRIINSAFLSPRGVTPIPSDHAPSRLSLIRGGSETDFHRQTNAHKTKVQHSQQQQQQRPNTQSTKVALQSQLDILIAAQQQQLPRLNHNFQSMLAERKSTSTFPFQEPKNCNIVFPQSNVVLGNDATLFGPALHQRSSFVSSRMGWF